MEQKLYGGLLEDREGLEEKQLGIDFETLKQDVLAIRRGMEGDLQVAGIDLQEDPTQTLERTLYAILNAYTECTAEFASGIEQQRDMSQLIAWTRQAGAAVCPQYHITTEADPRAFDLFVQVSVTLVVLLEDIGETFQHDKLIPLRRVVDALALRHLGEREGIELETLPEFGDLTTPQQNYVALVHESFILLEEAVDNLVQQDSPQLQQIRQRMDMAVREMFEMLAFSRAFNDMAQGRTKTLSAELLQTGEISEISYENPLERPDYIRQNQSNIFMRYMLLGNFLQQWGSMGEEEQAALHFDTLLDDVEEIGLAIEAIGNIGNDIATLFREIGEGFVCNVVFAEGIRLGVIDPEALTAAFEALRQLSPAQSEEFLAEITSACFAGNYTTIRPILEERYRNVENVLVLVDTIQSNNLLYDAVIYWRELFDLLSQFEGSEAERIMDLGDLWKRQTNFLYQHLTAHYII